MAKTKEIRNRIKSVKATHKITRTMEMVAAGRMKRAMDRMVEARPFVAGFQKVMGGLVSGGDSIEHPLLEVRGEIRREAVVVMSSNRGLCGAFNTNLFKRCMEEVRSIRDQGREVEIHTVGKKVGTLLRFQGESVHSARDIPDRPVFGDAENLAATLLERYQAPAGEGVDRITLVFARYHSALKQPPESMQVLPIQADPESMESSGGALGDATIFSPDREAILTRLLPLYLRSSILQAFLETTCSEQVARRNAMKNATENAEDMIKTLTRNLNKVRQALITRELAEIVGGSVGLD